MVCVRMYRDGRAKNWEGEYDWEGRGRGQSAGVKRIGSPLVEWMRGFRDSRGGSPR